jgi:hypothetical protein
MQVSVSVISQTACVGRSELYTVSERGQSSTGLRPLYLIIHGATFFVFRSIVATHACRSGVEYL